MLRRNVALWLQGGQAPFQGSVGRPFYAHLEHANSLDSYLIPYSGVSSNTTAAAVQSQLEYDLSGIGGLNGVSPYGCQSKVSPPPASITLQ